MPKFEFLVMYEVLLAFILVYEAELATILSQPPTPVRLLEGQHLKLEWMFSVQGTFRRVQLGFSGFSAGFVEKSLTGSFIEPAFEGRLTVGTTERNATITFFSINRTDSADYVFAVLDSSGVTEEPLKVIVEYPPSLITRGSVQVVLEGGPPINLTCTADGEPAPNITWTKVFANGSDSDVLFTGDPFILPSNRTIDGTYRCKASNGIGSDVNHTVTVVVHFKPERFVFTIKSSNENFCKGGIINITCSAVGKPMVNTYQLFKDGTPVHTSNNSVLFWSQEATAGGEIVYSCLANNTVAIASTTKNITVYEGSVVEQLDNVTAVEGTNTASNCIVTGIPMPSVSWLEVKTGNRFFENPLVFAIVSRKQAGEYTCETNNPCGNDSKKGFLSVKYPPEGVQLQVREETVCKGANVIFNCSAADANPMELTYYLYENNVIVSNSSSAGIWNRTMTTEGVFNYSCKVNNTVGTEMSLNVSVTVSVPPSIQPIDNEVVIEGGNVTLTCNASGFPTPTLYWVKTSNGVRFNRTELVFTNTSRIEAGEHICVASNPCNTATELADIDVQFKPEMVQLVPSQTTVCQGEITTFNCSANSNPAVHSYRLYVNGRMVVNAVSSTGVWNITMTTGGVFVYKCKVNNTIGTAMSENITITVNDPPSILPIDNEMVIEGGNVTLTCNASGFPAPTVYWVKTSNGDRFHETELVFTITSRSEAGEYKCVASNPCNTTTELADVDVQFPPEMVQLVPSKTTACQGEIVTFTCSANGNPAVYTYQLSVNGTMVNETSSSGVWNKTMITGGVFVYKCKVNNTIGTAMSETVTITVNEPPSILPFTRKEVTEGGNLRVRCIVSGIPLPTVFWVKTSNGERTNGTDLVFTNINRPQSGDYTCKASNPCGDATQTLEIDVQFKPEMVQFMASKTTLCKGESIFLNCSANSKPAVHSYQLYENGTMVSEGYSGGGVWFLTMETGGVFVYKCKVNNSIGTAMSESVSITVNEPATIETLEKTTVAEGGYLTLSCQVSGDPFPSVSWVKVMGGKRFNGSNLSLRNVSRTASGEYRCEAANVCSYVSRVTEVDVEYVPEITHISSPQNLNTGEMLTLNCTVDGNPAPTITWTRLSTGNIVNMPLNVTGKVYEGGYRCTASNSIGTVTKVTSITVNFPAVAVASADKNTVQKGGNVTLFCSVSGTPTPSVIWTHVDTGNKHYNETWIISDITFNDLGEYRCDAINIYGNDTNSTFILFKGGKCEEVCKDGRTCRSGLGTIPLCLCEEGKTGEKCEENESAENLFEAGLEFLMEFKDVYNDLENPERKTLTTKIEAAVKDELNGTGLTQVHVVSLRRGSVIADLELRFNRSIYQDSLRELLQDATRDNKLGDLEVKDVVVFGEFFPTEAPTEPPAYLIYATVVGVLVLIIASGAVYVIIKRKRRGREVKLLEERETVKESHFNLNIEDGRDNEGSIDAVNRAHCMELYEITDSHGTYSEINEYAPLNPATRSWEVSRENVTIKKVICKGAFGQVAQGTIQNLPLEKGITTVALKMLKETHQHEDYDTKLYENVEDLMS